MHDDFPQLLRAHRTRRRWSQEALALEARVSPRHLSCLETGKARPSREMVVQLATVLGLELRERNALLVGAGFAGLYPATPLDAAAMAPVNRAVAFVLAQHEPYAAVLIDRCWNVLRANAGAGRLLASFLDERGLPPAIARNLVRATLHPDGLRPHVVNWPEVAAVVCERVERACHAHPGDDERRALRDEIRAYPGLANLAWTAPAGVPVATLHLRRGDAELRLFTLLTSIGTPLDVTADGLALESLFPADDATERWFRARGRPGDRSA
ncbi:MAG TPA: helix-turn-helix transcriptional regulator [Kofleriaceae bacterium]|nr:helix-turn-helix transcriptional regulator [Kofleriaceae bacterium]